MQLNHSLTCSPISGRDNEVAELIVLLRQLVFDKTCCSPNSTLPRQLMDGEAIIG